VSGEFGLVGGGEEHVEDWVECVTGRKIEKKENNNISQANITKH